MKYKDLLKAMASYNFRFGHGTRHDYFTDGHYKIPIPRHKEISELTARMIIKEAEKLSGRRA